MSIHFLKKLKIAKNIFYAYINNSIIKKNNESTKNYLNTRMVSIHYLLFEKKMIN